ncbi:hypothetical protein GC163_18270 [bacterium]|nr:hypothetical protein [bacterium]
MPDPQQPQSTELWNCAEETFHRYPLATTLSVFGVGVGMGALIAAQLMTPDSPTREQSALALGQHMWRSMYDHLPQSLRG